MSEFPRSQKAKLARALALATALSASPAMAQGPQSPTVDAPPAASELENQQKPLSQDELQKVPAIISAVKEFLVDSNKRLRNLSNPKYAAEYKEKIDQMKELQDRLDPAFIRNVILLEAHGMKISHIFTVFSAEEIAHPSNIRRKLDLIPAELAEKIRVTKYLFTESDEKLQRLFSQEAVASTATYFKSKGYELDIRTIASLSKYPERHEQMVTIDEAYKANVSHDSHLIYLLSEDTGLFEVASQSNFISIMQKYKDLGVSEFSLLRSRGNLLDTAPFSQEYVDGITKLHERGFKMDYLIPGLSRELLTSPTFFENVDLLLKEKILNAADLTFVDNFFPSLITSASFKKNVEIIRKAGKSPVGTFLLLRVLDKHPHVLAIFERLLPLIAQNGNILNILQEYNNELLLDPLYVESCVEYAGKAAVASEEEKRQVYTADLARHYLSKRYGSRWTVAQDDPEAYRALFSSVDSKDISYGMLEYEERAVYTRFAMKMSRDVPAGERLADIRHMTPATKFYLIARAGSDGWPSTRNLIYDGYTHTGEERKYSLIEDIKNKYGSAKTFLFDLNPESRDLSLFIEQLTQMGKVESFFDLIGSDADRAEVVNKFLLGLEKEYGAGQKRKAASIIELARKQLWPNSQNLILSAIEREVQHLENPSTEKGSFAANHDKAAALWYRLIIADALVLAERNGSQKMDINPTAWMKEVKQELAEYLPPFDRIEEAEMFPNKTHIRYNAFFNDWDGGMKDKDGHRSLETTVLFFGGSIKYSPEGEIERASGGKNGWKISLHTAEGKWKYVLMVKKDVRSGRKIVNILNSPKMMQEEAKAFYEYMARNYKDPETGATGVQTMIQRGHVTWGRVWVDIFGSLAQVMRESGRRIPMADMGGCSGYEYTDQVQALSIGTFFKGTLSTGVADVNVRTQAFEMDALLRDGYYDSRKIKADTVKAFEGYSDRMKGFFQYYRYPHENEIAKIFAAHRRLSPEK